MIRRRAGIETRAVARGRLTATADNWCIEAALAAYENDSVDFDRAWTNEIARDHQ